ncbi:MAG: DNA primase [Armatimonadota bacterium]|nr:DNA primase [bacterium]
MSSFRYPVEEIRERCDLVEIVSAHVALRKTGRTYKGLCPFHNEKTPSFNVDPDRQLWKCFGCGEGGDVFSFVQKVENLTFPEAVEQLARKVGVTIEHSDQAAKALSERDRLFRANNVACTFFRKSLESSAKAKEYLARRGLAQSTVEKYRLGYAPGNWDDLLNHLMRQRISPADAVKAGLIKPRESSQGFYDIFRDRLMFPILDSQERVIGFGGRVMGDGEPKYLNSPETPLFVKNRTLYGLNFARRAITSNDSVLIVEGYMDVIAAQEAGFENTVATLGTALTEEHVNVIARFTRNVVLSFDADSAGMKAALRSSPIFERAGFNTRILSMPKGEDPDSMLRGGNVSGFASVIKSAVSISDFRIGLILARYDMSSDEGRADALKKIAGVIAEAESVVDRERLIRNLAKYHPNFSTGTTLAEDHLRAEVNRFRSKLARNVPNRTESAKKETVGSVKKPITKLSLLRRSECLLLGIIILRNSDANKVFDALPPKEFTGEDTCLLAQTVSRLYSETGKIDQERLRSEVAGTPAEKLLMDLFMGLDDSEMNHPASELVHVIQNHKKNERRQRMRALAAQIQAGTISRSDPEYEEWARLVKETSSPWRR